MRTKPLQAAILIFVVGASLLNLLDVSYKHQAIGYEAMPTAPPPTSTPIPTPKPQKTDDGGPPNPWGDPWADTHGPWTPDPDEVAEVGINVSAHATYNNLALEREVIILTVAGIAWFIVAARASKT